jgi:hypothetical protein
MTELPRRFWVEVGLAVFSAFLILLTLVWKDWIEIVFRVDPDHGNGSFEWLLVTLAIVGTVTFSTLARHEWERAQAATT